MVLVKLRYASGWRFPGGGGRPGEQAEEEALRQRGEEIGMVSHVRVRLACELEQSVDSKRDLSALLMVEDARYVLPRWSMEVEQVGEFRLEALPPDNCARDSRLDRDAARSHLEHMHRLFVAIRPPERIRDLLLDAMDDSADFRWQDEEQLHLTLRFVGEVERPVANDFADALSRIESHPFELRIAGIGRFEQRNSGALWAGVEPKPSLTALAAKIERACQSVGLEPERRAFHPHITLARWKGRRTREVQQFLEARAGLSSGPFAADSFTLFESRLSRHGAHYEPVASYPLVK